MEAASYQSNENKFYSHTISEQNKPFLTARARRKFAVDNAQEQATDTIAEKAMPTSSDKVVGNLFFKPSISLVQRKCAHCEEEEKKQLQRKEGNNRATNLDTSTGNYIKDFSGKGKLLTQKDRKFFEPAFGYDFSNVKLHTNETTNQSAESINALAYTHQNNIVFGVNQYQPNTYAGNKLLAHELTHVVQQQKSNLKIQRSVSPRDVSCNAYPRSYPIFAWMGTTDPVSAIQAADKKAIELLSSTIDQLNFVKNKISSGSAAAYPTISDCMGESIRTRLLINPENVSSWTGNGVGSIGHFVGWLVNLKRTFEAGGVRYNCRGPECKINYGAYIMTGQGFLVNLCQYFWTFKDVNIRALMLIHEFAHVYYDTEDSGRGEGSSYCIEGVVADLNGLHATIVEENENCGGEKMQAC